MARRSGKKVPAEPGSGKTPREWYALGPHEFAEMSLHAFLGVVDELRERARAEFLDRGEFSPETLELLRGVSLAARGAHVDDREILQCIAVEAVERWLSRIRGGEDEIVELPAALLLTDLQFAVGGEAGEKLASVPIDQETIRMLTASRREAVGVLAWLMVRSGALVEHPARAPADECFDGDVKRAVGKLRAALRSD